MKGETILVLVALLWFFSVRTGGEESQAEVVETEVDEQRRSRSYYPYD